MGEILSIPEYSIKRPTLANVSLSSNGKTKNFPFLTIDKDSYIGGLELRAVFLSYDEQLFNFQIGKYNSIADNIKIIVDSNHDYKKVFQGRISGFPYSAPVYTNRKGQVIIQNDCWIGTGSTILGGVTIHNGAVAAANSMVTKDVPPYAIVAGNPAKIVGYRFEPEQIEALLKIAWWEWSDEKLQSCQESLNSDIDSFIHEHIDSANDSWNTILKIDIPRISPKIPSYLFFVDLDSEFPLCEKVISEFAAKFSNQEAELILYVNEDTSAEVLTSIDEILQRYSEYNCVINILSGFSYDERILFNCVDFYITNRSIKNIQRMCTAELLNTECISSVNSIMFK